VELKRLYVLFAIEIATLRGPRARGDRHPVGAWVAQQARDLLMAVGDDLGRFRFVLCDRDTKFTAAFGVVLPSRGSGCCPRRYGHRGQRLRGALGRHRAA